VLELHKEETTSVVSKKRYMFLSCIFLVLYIVSCKTNPSRYWLCDDDFIPEIPSWVPSYGMVYPGSESMVGKSGEDDRYISGVVRHSATPWSTCIPSLK